MRVLIIDDSDIKAETIIDCISSAYPHTHFSVLDNYVDAAKLLEKIKNTSLQYDLLILDWYFPRYRNHQALPDMGEEFLKFMSEKEIKLSTIICSSEDVHPRSEYENVIGKVLFSYLMKNEEFVEIIEEKLNIKSGNPHSASVDTLLDEEISSQRPISNSEAAAKELEDKLLNDMGSYSLVKNREYRRNKRPGYTRKKSSEPWWKN